MGLPPRRAVSAPLGRGLPRRRQPARAPRLRGPQDAGDRGRGGAPADGPARPAGNAGRLRRGGRRYGRGDARDGNAHAGPGAGAGLPARRFSGGRGETPEVLRALRHDAEPGAGGPAGSAGARRRHRPAPAGPRDRTGDHLGGQAARRPRRGRARPSAAVARLAAAPRGPLAGRAAGGGAASYAPAGLPARQAVRAACGRRARAGRRTRPGRPAAGGLVVERPEAVHGRSGRSGRESARSGVRSRRGPAFRRVPHQGGRAARPRTPGRNDSAAPGADARPHRRSGDAVAGAGRRFRARRPGR